VIDLDDFHVDRSDAKSVADFEHRIIERAAVKARVGRPATNSGSGRAADNDTVNRLNTGTPQPQRALRTRANRALGGTKADRLLTPIGP